MITVETSQTIYREIDMVQYTKKFTCEDCKCQEFDKEYEFFVDFKNVNFSDDLVYDKRTEEVYVCKNCGKKYAHDFIQNKIEEIIYKYKNNEW